MEYFEQLGLTKEPFSNTPDPAFFYRSREHQEALYRLEIAIRTRRGLSVILGAVGTGKTTLSRILLQQFEEDRDKFVFRMMLDPNFQSEFEFLKAIMEIFEVRSIPNSTLECKNILQNHLYKLSLLEEKNPVLLLDEGQMLTPTYMEVLRNLLNYETNEQKLLQVVIFAQPEFLLKIKKKPNFNDRIALGYSINPLNLVETKELIEYRLKKAGLKNGRILFQDDAIEHIYYYTNGYPRKIINTCHEALITMLRSDKEVVDGEMMQGILKQKELWNALV
ncbi:MAG: transposase [Candidatus Neomarinimicrobiota bacterium]|nr:MAG: transposase [Candidatus Neomarinimicrobiota bacterium]